jgi:hypothetical protein
MGKKFKATSYSEESTPPSRPPSASTDYSSHSRSSYEPATQSTPDYSPPTESEKSKAVGFSILILVVGVILTPILIGIPIVIIGFWMMLFPGYWVNKAKRS